MQIPRSYIDNYSKALNVVSEQARVALVDALSKLDYNADIADTRNEVIAIMQVACGASTTMAARLAAEFYDGLRAKFGIKDGFFALVDSLRNPAATAGAVRAFVEVLVKDKPIEQFINLCGERISYETGKAANECIAYNAEQDPVRPKWARIPTGEETCPWCLMLASRGFDYNSEATASHNHAGCDCKVVPSWDTSPEAQGYNPVEYYDKWQRAIYEEAKEAAERKGTSIKSERKRILGYYEASSRNAKRRKRF